MLQLSHYSFNLPFEYPFTIAKGTKTHQPSLVVSLGLRHWRGFGEAPAISYYNVSVEAMTTLLEAKRPLIERYALTDPERFWHFLHHLYPGEHFLIAALDIAGWDLFAQMRNMPLNKLLQIPATQAPLTDYTIGIATAEQMAAKIIAHPWPIYKIKMCKADDIDLLRAMRAVTDKPFRVDANEAFSYDDAIKLIPELQQLGVELLEQPLQKNEWDAMKELKNKSILPLFADESCVGENDVLKCSESFDGINIKLTKCGGITPALRMIKQARELGLNVMMGSMNESSIGSAAVVHLMPLLDAVDADGPLLLSEDIAEGLKYDQGKITTSGYPGLGIRFWGEPKSSNKFK
jgi:L-Ala-D/L-Glu epimerase